LILPIIQVLATVEQAWYPKMNQNRTMAKTLDQVNFCRYPRALRFITDNENECLGTKFQEIFRSYGVQPIHTTIKNPQANFVERVHQTLGNMIRTYELENFEFDYDNP
jgi:hypothetical protein